MKKIFTHFFSLISLSVGLAVSLSAQTLCTGYTTYTQGGYGGKGAPAQYLTANFSSSFPNGLTIGCGGNTLLLTSATAVNDFLPSGTTASGLNGSLINPGQSYQNVLAGQLVTLTLNTKFTFQSAPGNLGSLIIKGGRFDGMTVNAFLALANSIIGGCSTSYSFADINVAATAINENYDNGTIDKGYLTCCNVNLTATANQPKCFGDLGNVTLSVTGGTSPFVFEGNTSGLAAGSYNYTVTDANGCKAFSNEVKILNAPSKIVFTATPNQPKCFGELGSVTLSTPTGGTGTITFDETPTTNLSAGVYTYTATDENGCFSSVSVTIKEAPPAINFTAIADQPKCFGDLGNVTLSSPFGGTGEITFDSTSTTNLSAGVYTYTATDENGCLASVPVTINEAPKKITFSAIPSQPKCFGNLGTITLSTPSGGTGLISFNETPISGLAAGTYTYIATDENGCSVSTKVVINAAPSALVLSIDKTDVYCLGGTGTATAKISGGTSPYAYSWSNGQFSATSDLPVGNWSVLVTDNNNCTISGNVTLALLTCDKYLTVTQGGWGAKCNGGNWGCYLDANFNSSFPTGLTVGSNGKYLKLTSALAIHNFLPSGGTPAALTGSVTNPTTKTLKNTLAGQIVALTLSLTFDANNANFSQADQWLGNMLITKGVFDGFSVSQLLSESNKALGGNSIYSLSDLTAALDAINKNYDGGVVDLGFLACPCSGSAQKVSFDNNFSNIEETSLIDIYPNPIIESSIIKFHSNYNTSARVVVYNVNGQIIKTLFNGNINASEENSVTFNAADFEKGIYFVKFDTGNDVQTKKIIVK